MVRFTEHAPASRSRRQSYGERDNGPNNRARTARVDVEEDFFASRWRRSLADAWLVRRCSRTPSAPTSSARAFSKVVPSLALSDANAAVTNVGGGCIFGSGDIQSSRRRRVLYCKYLKKRRRRRHSAND
mmetsp:Transcript_7939/g.26250  ORF Transcript_7939/g.26250 Transcript_7939/m.26250 type:complete len:129 (+) Transcript_7939:1043-1429(+)